MLEVKPLSNSISLPQASLVAPRNNMIYSVAVAVLIGGSLGLIVVKLKAKYRRSKLGIPKEFFARKVFYAKTALLDFIYPMEPVIHEGQIIYRYVSVKNWSDYPKRIFTSPLAKAAVTILTYECVKKCYSIYVRGIS